MEEKKVLKLSDQSIGCIMIALQKALIEQCDITETFRGFELQEEDIGLVVLNPPIFEIKNEESKDE